MRFAFSKKKVNFVGFFILGSSTNSVGESNVTPN